MKIVTVYIWEVPSLNLSHITVLGLHVVFIRFPRWMWYWYLKYIYLHPWSCVNAHPNDHVFISSCCITSVAERHHWLTNSYSACGTSRILVCQGIFNMINTLKYVEGMQVSICYYHIAITDEAEYVFVLCSIQMMFITTTPPPLFLGGGPT